VILTYPLIARALIGPVDYEDGEFRCGMWPAHGGVPHQTGRCNRREVVWSPVGDFPIAIIQGNRLLNGPAPMARHEKNFRSSLRIPYRWCGPG